MPTHSASDLLDLLREAQNGSAEAAQVLFDRFRRPLLAVIRHELFFPLRKLYDSDDFIMETFVEIFTLHINGKVLGSPQALWPYLKKTAENKVRDKQRKHLISKCHSIKQEVSLEAVPLQEEMWSRDLSPQDALLLKELFEERLADLIEQLPSALQEMIDLLLQGYNGQEIAFRLNMEPKRVYRAMTWLRKKIQE